MVDLNNIKRIYFIGIGGIGMSALARYFQFHGKTVSGYDRTETVLTKKLAEEGIDIHYVDDVALAPKDAELVVYTPAVPKDHKELGYYREHEYTVLKRSDVLGAITNSSFNICVAGTHGKTTVSTMIAFILRHSGYGCNAFLGGISVNYNSNFWSDRRNVCVVEADEYDRSFLRLSPDIAIVTAMDADHLDIYGTAAEVEQAFIDFSARVKPGGLLVHKAGLARGTELKGDSQYSYQAQGAGADVYATDVVMDHGSYVFRVQGPGWILENVVLNMGGMHNVENVTAAIAVAHELGIADDAIRVSVAAFRGVKRRFEYIVKEAADPSKGKNAVVYIDDYAHHPEELRALISGARGLFPGLRCTILFQPHLFTRTRDFADGFAESLGLADEIYLLPIYPARELPIEGVTSEMIAERMDQAKVSIVEKTEFLDRLSGMIDEGKRPQLLITAGAGDIDTLIGPIGEILKSEA